MTAAPEGSWRPKSPSRESDPPFESSRAGRWVLIPLLLVVGLVVLLSGLTAFGQTHQHEACALGDDGCRHAEFHNFYQLINAITKRNCCSEDNRECRPTNAYMENGTWFAVVDGQTVPVPAHAIVAVENLTPYFHVCAVKHSWSNTPAIHCFIVRGLQI